MLNNRLTFFAKGGMLIFFLLLCFIPIRKTVSPYYWGYDNDNYRDMANVNNLVSGNLTEDPSYLGEFRWYNPMLHWIEAGIVKVTGIPVNQVISQGGPYLNILGPVCFFFMVLVLFDFLISICATAGFLFFTAVDIPGYFSATYTPWLYPVTFVQFIFYLGIVSMYFAFINPKIKRFALLGLMAGLVFLGHTGPTVILILQIAVLTSILLLKIIKKTSEQKITYVMKCVIAAAICFFIISLPYTYIVIGKYHLKLINVATYEYAEPMFQIRNLMHLFKINFSVSLLVSIFGMYALAKSKIPMQIKQILYSWLVISLIMYSYVTLSKFIRFRYGISFPGVVPSFHFYFYIKSLQAIFFGFGFVELIRRIFHLISIKYNHLKFTSGQVNAWIMLLISATVIIGYPIYLNRGDFYAEPAPVIDEYHLDQIGVYQWLTTETGINQVVLCEDEEITFPLLPSGRKMVACTIDHTNPYVDFFARKKDRDLMLAILKGKAPDNHALFTKYKVKYVLINNSLKYHNLVRVFPIPVYSNKTFSVYATM